MTYRLSVMDGTAPSVTMPAPRPKSAATRRRLPRDGDFVRCVAEMALAGLKLGEIVARTGATYNAVNGTLAKLRREGRIPKRKPITDQIDALAASGLSSAEIIRQTGASATRVYSRLHELRAHGKAPPPRPRSRAILRPGGRPERVRDMMLAGASVEEIAAAVETTVSTVTDTVYRLRKDGHLLPSNDRPRPRGRPRATVARLDLPGAVTP